jgi:hypothetical protein
MTARPIGVVKKLGSAEHAALIRGYRIGKAHAAADQMREFTKRLDEVREVVEAEAASLRAAFEVEAAALRFELSLARAELSLARRSEPVPARVLH